jgi:4-amino-4-deoxy-L-arabinose transferase-like glycosyltransferase
MKAQGSSGAPPSATRRRALGHERGWVALLLVIHVGLAVWGAVRSSVTFDENFHLPAGVLIVARGELRVSVVNPPLVKALCGAAALAAGARLPAEEALRNGEQGVVGESFMRRNADRYQRVFVAARLVIVAFSLLLGLVVWRVARRLHGPRGGVLALGFYAFMPEALAHAGLATMDVATALGCLASVYAFWMFARSGRWGWWWMAAGAVAFAFLVRFTALLLGPMLLVVAILEALRHRARRPARLWLGLLLLVPVVFLALDAGYLGGVSFAPLRDWRFLSTAFQALQHRLPDLRLPLPDLWLLGMDRQAVDTGTVANPTFLLGHVIPLAVWYYFPLAFLFKWPLGFLGALLARTGPAFARRRSAFTPRHRGAFLAVPVAFYLGGGMFLLSLNAGIRYMFPIMPVLCVWLGGIASARLLERLGGRRRLWLSLGVALAVLQAVETGLAAPWYLSFFNWPSGGPGGGYMLVNDSNVDWGQGLIALRDEQKRRGIGRIYLAYHGTTDPVIYGIDYIPYSGGAPGRESDWLAVSSYYFVGLGQRMMTQHGRTPDRLYFDFRPLWGLRPEARLGGSIYLFPLRGAGLVR